MTGNPQPQPDPLTAFRDDAETRRAVLRAAEGWWSLGRLATFIAAVTVWYPLRDSWPVAVAASLGGVALFVLTVRRHVRAKHARLFAQRQVLICDEAAPRCRGELCVVRSATAPDEHIEAMDRLSSAVPNDPHWALSGQEIDDLDLYAEPVGLFGLLNRASTSLGAARLARWLSHPCIDAEVIRPRQAGVQWLSTQLPQRVRVMAACAGLRGGDARLNRLVAAIDEAVPLQRAPWLISAIRLWSLLSVAAVLAGGIVVLMGHYWWGMPALVLVAFNAMVFMGMMAELEKTIRPWRALRPVVDACRHAVEVAAVELADNEHFATLHNRVAAVADEAWPAVARRLGWTDHGGAFHHMFNFMFFFDVHVAQALCSAVVPHKAALLDSIGAIADLEALCGLACFADEQPRATWPEFADETVIDIDTGCHPLIPPDEVRPNSAKLGLPAGTWIVTGSNMAGKSTFIRMVASNCLLAQVGTVTLADRARLRPVRLMTDLRIRDDVSRHESYFLAEVRQLRRMLIDDDKIRPILGLIDEPLRGTNSEERVAASMAMVQHLAAQPHLFIVATHERVLTDLADGKVAENYHFEEHLVEEGRTFDYTLRPGPAQERNALRVMEREGFPASMIAHAREQLSAEGQGQTDSVN